jgi:hypothetical protein
MEDSRSMASTEEETGVSWGEILECVSGRKELPAWPPFTISADAPDLASEMETPMQKLDMDIPDEYRDHYIRQSKKTKNVVQAWLKSQPEARTSPPQEVDDETLMFAMITHLESDQRRLFTALLRGMSTLPASRAPTPMEKPRSELMVRSGLALQRLYRLRSPPRDAECSLFLLKNPQLHSVLATLAAISSGEWDVLVSGRFDGFLWSGAETAAAPSRGPTPAPPSRTTTPFSPGMLFNGMPGTPFSGMPGTPFSGMPGTPFSSRDGPSRAQTPAVGSIGAPVQMDEDTEIAVLAEVEREIYAGMDALEDAFETLHTKAETVRAALRARGAGLSMTASARRGLNDDGPEIRGATPYGPGLGMGIWGGWDTETDDGMDVRSELAPSDSASNISYHRRRRRPDRRELRTPGTVTEEEDEDGAGERRRR